MKTNSLTNKIIYKEDKPSVELLFETSFSKEIRILLKQGQVMKEHQTPFPIVVELFEGEVDFGVQGKTYFLKKGDVLTLDGAIPHDLKALKNSILRLTLSKHDKVERVAEVAQK